MVEKNEPVPENDGRKLLEHVVLEGHGGRQPARRDGPVGGPGQGVRRPARHAVNLTVLQDSHQPRSLNENVWLPLKTY